ncbi:MAG TPA: glycosyltransferase [Methanotrichaceae archaeon]|nr:glycosyltransferase [Methanotrichaceae archaeon]
MPPFVRADYDLLDAIDAPYTGLRDLPGLLFSIIRADTSFSWFAGGHAALAVVFSRLFGKRSIVVLGGYEVAKLPEIGYGACLNRKSAFMAKFSIQNADEVLAVDESLKQEAIRNYGLSGDNISIVPTGYDANHFRPDGPKENLVLTVSPQVSYERKGIPLFIEAARCLPDIRFIVVGKGSIDAPPNVEFPGHITDEELLHYYQRAKVYCQLSLHEGLPNALCEAMLCECVPIGSRANGIPKAIGNTGYYADDVASLVKAIQQALDFSGKPARARIRKLFPMTLRRAAFESL